MARYGGLRVHGLVLQRRPQRPLHPRPLAAHHVAGLVRPPPFKRRRAPPPTPSPPPPRAGARSSIRGPAGRPERALGPGRQRLHDERSGLCEGCLRAGERRVPSKAWCIACGRPTERGSPSWLLRKRAPRRRAPRAPRPARGGGGRAGWPSISQVPHPRHSGFHVGQLPPRPAAMSPSSSSRLAHPDSEVPVPIEPARPVWLAHLPPACGEREGRRRTPPAPRVSLTRTATRRAAGRRGRSARRPRSPPPRARSASSKRLAGSSR